MPTVTPDLDDLNRLSKHLRRVPHKGPAGDGHSLSSPYGIRPVAIELERKGKEATTPEQVVGDAITASETLVGGAAEISTKAPDVLAVEKLDQILGHAMLPAFFLPMGAGAVAGGLNALGTGVKYVGLSPVAKGFHAAGGGINKAVGLLELPVSKLGGVGNLFANAIGFAVRPVVGALDVLNRVIGIVDWRANQLGNKLAASNVKVTHHANRAFAHMGSANAELKGALQAVHGHILHDMPDEKTLGEAFESARGLAKKSGNNPLVKELKALEKHVGVVGELSGKVERLGNLSKAVDQLPERIAKTSIHNAVNNSLMTATTVTSSYLTARDIGSYIYALRDMAADYLHVKPSEISVSKLLFGKLPEPVASARSKLILTAGPRAVLEGAAQVLNLKMIFSKHTGFLGMMGVVGLSMLSHTVGSMVTGDLLDVYKNMKANESVGKKNTPELYAELLGLASKELHDRGGIKSKFAQMMGEIYAQKKYTVGQVLDAAQNGQLMKDIDQLQKESAEIRAEAATSSKTKLQMPTNTLSHVEVVKQNGKAKPVMHVEKDRTVLGKHTHQVTGVENKPLVQGI